MVYNTAPYTASNLVATWSQDPDLFVKALPLDGGFDLGSDNFLNYAQKEVGYRLAPLLAFAVIACLVMGIWSCCTCCSCGWCGRRREEVSGKRKSFAIVVLIAAVAATAGIVIYGLDNNADQDAALKAFPETISETVSWTTDAASAAAAANAAADAYTADFIKAANAFYCEIVAKTMTDPACTSGTVVTVQGAEITAITAAVAANDAAVTEFKGTAVAEITTLTNQIDLGAFNSFSATIESFGPYRNSGVLGVCGTILGLIVLMIGFAVRNLRKKGGDAGSCLGNMFESVVAFVFMVVSIVIWVISILLCVLTIIQADICFDPDNVFDQVLPAVLQPVFEATPTPCTVGAIGDPCKTVAYGSFCQADPGGGADRCVADPIRYYIECDQIISPPAETLNPLKGAGALADSTFQTAEEEMNKLLCALKQPTKTDGFATVCPAVCTASDCQCTSGTCSNGKTDEALQTLKNSFDALAASSGAQTPAEVAAGDPRGGLLEILSCPALNGRYQAVLHLLCDDVFTPIAHCAAIFIAVGFTMLLTDCTRRIVRPGKGVPEKQTVEG